MLPSCLSASELDIHLINEQLERMFEHSAFKHSKRSRDLLRYIVEYQLGRHEGMLKERTIGVEVFARELDYDTGSDPVVRMAAIEIRKRIAQYYHEPLHQRELQINVPAGAYVAEFSWPEAADNVPMEQRVAGTDSKTVLADSPNVSWRQKTIQNVLIGVMSTILLVGTAVWLEKMLSNSSLEQFWKPVMSSASPLVVSVGTWNLSAVISADPPNVTLTNGIRDLLPMTDAQAFARVIGYLISIHRPYRIMDSKDTTLSDLTGSPAIYVGAYDNPWTLRMTDTLRFHFVRNLEYQRAGIVDRRIPDKEYMSSSDSGTIATTDYAIIARFVSPTTGQTSVVVAGLGRAGTTAASEFVTQSRYTDELTRQMPSGSLGKSLEMLISVQVIGGTPGAPHIEAVETW